jgi:hypothetical protein
MATCCGTDAKHPASFAAVRNVCAPLLLDASHGHFEHVRPLSQSHVRPKSADVYGLFFGSPIGGDRVPQSMESGLNRN